MNNFNVEQYWNERYKKGGNSGHGSHFNRSVIFKAKFVNDVINKYNVKTIIELGCGDGNQLKEFKNYELYHGTDISENIINKNIKKFSNDNTKKFSTNLDDFDIKKYDLSLSLDVTYHLVNEDMFNEYLETLFNLSDLVCLFTTDMDDPYQNAHGLHRKITKHIENKYKNYELIKTERYLKEVSTDTLSFFLYKKM